MRILLLFIALCLTLMGCTSWRSASYKSAGTAVITADIAMKAWAKRVAAGKATPEQEKAVKSAYEKYQKSMLTAIDAGKASTTSTDTNALGIAIGTVVAVQADLVNLVQSFLPEKIKP